MWTATQLKNLNAYLFACNLFNFYQKQEYVSQGI
jgi:hypothetical protein